MGPQLLLRQHGLLASAFVPSSVLVFFFHPLLFMLDFSFTLISYPSVYYKVFLVTWLHRSKSLHNITVFTNELATYVIRPHTYSYLFNVPWSASLMVSVTC